MTFEKTGCCLKRFILFLALSRGWGTVSLENTYAQQKDCNDGHDTNTSAFFHRTLLHL